MRRARTGRSANGPLRGNQSSQSHLPDSRIRAGSRHRVLRRVALRSRLRKHAANPHHCTERLPRSQCIGALRGGPGGRKRSPERCAVSAHGRADSNTTRRLVLRSKRVRSSRLLRMESGSRICPAAAALRRVRVTDCAVSASRQKRLSEQAEWAPGPSIGRRAGAAEGSPLTPLRRTTAVLANRREHPARFHLAARFSRSDSSEDALVQR
jgi:hypothetical protein